MRLRSIQIENFRSLKDVHIDFDDDLTVIVGENDSGKSSLVDCIRVVTQGRSVDVDDFTSGTDSMALTVVIENLSFKKTYLLQDGSVAEQPLVAKPTPEYLRSLKDWLSDTETDFQQEQELGQLKETARGFGIQVRSNSSAATLKSRMLEAIQALEDDPSTGIDNARFPAFNNIQLDGKHFENVTAFFKEVFLKEKQSSLWQAETSGHSTILDVVTSAVDEYAEEMKANLEQSDIKDKLRVFLPTLTDILVKPNFTPQDFNLDAEVRFLEDGGEIDLRKKGDGTKRRVTMALLELKKEASLVENDNSTVYLLDEPDTHLHVRAQIQLLDTLSVFARGDNQVILSTHSPFIINAVHPDQVRLLTIGSDQRTHLKQISAKSEPVEYLLRAIGVENVYLFFARTLILVEGETEREFTRAHIKAVTGEDPHSRLVKIIDVKGIGNVSGFARAILEIHDKDHVYVVHDNEMSDGMIDLMSQLSLPSGNEYCVGAKEFEDAFSSDVLHRVWCQHIENLGKEVPSDWTEANVEALKERCLADPDLKFSAQLRKLSAGSATPMRKPVLGMLLGQYSRQSEVPQPLPGLFEKIKNA